MTNRVEGKSPSKRQLDVPGETHVVLSGRTLQKVESWGFFPAEKKTPVFRQCSMLNSHVLGITLSLRRSRGSKEALALNRYGEFAVAGREIAVLPECRIQPSAAVSSLSDAENERLQPDAILLRAASSAHIAKERFWFLLVSMHSALRFSLILNLLFLATFRFCVFIRCYTSAFCDEQSRR